MGTEREIRIFRRWYATLIRLYPKQYRDRFGEPMKQTFNDLLRERVREEKGLFGFTLRMLFETFLAAVRENMALIIQSKALVRISLGTALLLLVPLIAMQFTNEVNWDLLDFVVAGGLLFGAGLTFELIARKGGNVAYRAGVGIAVAAALLLIWINLAVGIIGNEGNPANLMYVGVLAVAVIGALIVRFQPQGMARVFIATALAQMLVAVIAQIADLGFTFVLNGFFATLWVGAALLFRRAARNSVDRRSST